MKTEKITVGYMQQEFQDLLGEKLPSVRQYLQELRSATPDLLASSRFVSTRPSELAISLRGPMDILEYSFRRLVERFGAPSCIHKPTSRGRRVFNCLPPKTEHEDWTSRRGYDMILSIYAEQGIRLYGTSRLGSLKDNTVRVQEFFPLI